MMIAYFFFAGTFIVIDVFSISNLQNVGPRLKDLSSAIKLDCFIFLGLDQKLNVTILHLINHVAYLTGHGEG